MGKAGGAGGAFVLVMRRRSEQEHRRTLPAPEDEQEGLQLMGVITGQGAIRADLTLHHHLQKKQSCKLKPDRDPVKEVGRNTVSHTQDTCACMCVCPCPEVGGLCDVAAVPDPVTTECGCCTIVAEAERSRSQCARGSVHVPDTKRAFAGIFCPSGKDDIFWLVSAFSW